MGLRRGLLNGVEEGFDGGGDEDEESAKWFENLRSEDLEIIFVLVFVKNKTPSSIARYFNFSRRQMVCLIIF